MAFLLCLFATDDGGLIGFDVESLPAGFAISTDTLPDNCVVTTNRLLPNVLEKLIYASPSPAIKMQVFNCGSPRSHGILV